jgi:oligosaccharyltransferase complex subunit beta
MRSFLSVVVLLFAAAVSALSTTGNRLLVVLDELADKDAYGYFLGDIAGMAIALTGSGRREEC